jgi:hypothetical protein
MGLKNFPLALVMIFLIGCAHSVIVPFENSKVSGTRYAPVLLETVGVYRVARPFKEDIEIGLISYRSRSSGIGEIYEQMRTDAAEYGAQAVVDVKISSETHSEMQMDNQCTPITKCSGDGTCTSSEDCHPIPVWVSVTTFLGVGSMIREKTL